MGEKDISIALDHDSVVVGDNVGAEVLVDPEIEAIINRGYRGLVRDMFRDKDIDPTHEVLVACREVLETDLSKPDYPERGRRVISLRYGIDGQPPLSTYAAARELNNTQERIRQLQEREVLRLRHPRRGNVGALSGILGREPNPIAFGNERIRSRETL